MINMKKSLILALLLTGGLSFMACEDDRDDNPVLTDATEFVLNQPEYTSQVIDLEHSESLTFTVASQPNYGFPVAVEYTLQLSTSGTFTTSVAEAEEVDTLVADYISLDPVQSTTLTPTAEAFNKALVQLNKWEETDVPATVEVTVRVLAEVVHGGHPIVSNEVVLDVAPYYVMLKDADPEMWYLVGGCIGSSAWGNSPDAIGTGLVPMGVVKDAEYDKKTGAGKVVYTGYFPANAEFKIVRTPGDWNNYVWCGDGVGKAQIRIGGDDPGNIQLADAGYYTINIDGQAMTCDIVKLESEPTLYQEMLITGDFDEWAASAPMTAVNTGVEKNHVWSYVIDATAGPTTAKFLQSGWSVNWGSTTFPYGIGVGNGPNIPVAQGKWLVIFNDIDGTYGFFPL